MKRIRARILLLLVSVACLAPAVAVAQSSLVPLPDRNPQRAAVPAAPVAEAVPVPEGSPVPEATPEAAGAPATASDTTTVTGTIPLPDRNPKTTPVPMTPSPVTPTVTPGSDVAAAVSTVALPDRNPKAPSLLAPPSLPLPPSPAPQVVTDMPLPDPNPNRAGALPFAMKGTLAPAIAVPPPAMDYDSILKPILSYDLSTGDEANIREVIRSGPSAAARIKDPAARDFALWYKHRNSPATGYATAIEDFRLSHPDWPAQDELREKAETTLFLTDASPDAVKTFFSTSTPQTGAGKAALASVYRKDGNEAGARDLRVSAWRDHQLNAAVEKKILDRYGNMLTVEHHRARIDRLLYPDEKGATEAALRVSKLLSV